MSLTLKKITDAIKEPARKVWNGDLKTMLIDNPAAIRLWTYGDRVITGVVPPHDHDVNGGELINGSLLSLALGPYLREGTSSSSFVKGIPLTRGDYTNSPKLLLSALVTLPAGVSRLRGALLVHTGAASGSTTLTPVLRGVAWHNFRLVDNTSGVMARTDITWTATGDNYYLLEWSWLGRELGKAKNLKSSARCEFCIYQKGLNFPPSGAQILGGELWIDDIEQHYVAKHNTSKAPLAQITYSDILSGKILLTSLSRKIRNALNDATLGVLGRAPGLEGTNPDRLSRWMRIIKTPHSHRGFLVPDGRGGFIADGACLRYPPRATAVWPRNWGEDATALKNADASQVKGLLIHSGGALDNTWLSWDFDIDLESGLGALDLMCAVEPGNTTDSSRLLLHVGIFSFGASTNYAATIKCDYHNQESVDAGGLLVCEVEPEENDAWVPNQERRLAGKSVYSQNAKKTEASASILVQTTNAYRISKKIKVGISQPAYQAGGVARATGRYVLRVRFSLPSGSAYDGAARVLAFEATAATGY